MFTVLGAQLCACCRYGPDPGVSYMRRCVTTKGEGCDGGGLCQHYTPFSVVRCPCVSKAFDAGVLIKFLLLYTWSDCNTW